MRWRFQRRVLRLRQPSLAAHGSTSKRELLILEVSDGSNTGVGEAAPIESYSGVNVDGCERALAIALEKLAAADPDDPGATVGQLKHGLPGPASAALEVALYDLAARRRGVTIGDLFAPQVQDEVGIRWLVGAVEARAASDEAERAVERGFRSVKLKVGIDRNGDSLKAHEVRQAVGPGVHVSADANGAWAEAEAQQRIEQLADTVDLVEQPVRGVDAMRRASGHSAVPLALDEDATEDLALDTPAAAAVVCLKLQAWGGIGNLIEAAEAARRAGMLVTLGSTLEGPVGIAASLTAAQIIGPELDSGLGTLEVFEEDFPVLTAADGRLSAPGGIGLGVDADGVRC